MRLIWGPRSSSLGAGGGHGEKRATFTLVPEAADHIARHAPEAPGRRRRGGWARVGSGANARRWCGRLALPGPEEALAHPAMREAALRPAAMTRCGTVTDIMRILVNHTAGSCATISPTAGTTTPTVRAALAQELPRWQARWPRGMPAPPTPLSERQADRCDQPAADILRDIARSRSDQGQTFTW